MSVFVVYEGRRLAIKIASPNTIIQDIIVESATNFNLDPSKCVLKHKRNIVSNSQLFRFSNISNNAEVELIFEKSKSVLSPCKIAVTLPSGHSVTKIIPCESTLFGLIQLLINDGNVSSDTVSLNPELIYLRNSYSGDILNTLTLQSLGLAGQAIRFTLKVSIQKALSNSIAIVTNETETEMEVEKHSTIQNTEANGTKTNSSQILVSVADNKCLESNVEANTCSGDNYRNTEMSDSTIDNIPDLTSAFDCLEKMITDNFDRVTIPAVITIAKYFNNILENPYNNKFRNINMNNKVFQSNVASTRGSLEYLLSVGFIINESKSSLQYPEGSDTSECSKLRIRCKELYAIMDRLNIPTENRPVQVSEHSSSAGSSSMQSQAPLPFDPFKASVVRQAPQPIRNEVSSVDNKIELLQKRRAEIEGRIEDVERMTEVFFPDQKEGIVKLLQHEVEINVNDDDNDVEDSSVLKMVNRSIAKVLKNSSSHEDAPLTTASLKTLRQLEKEKVYKQLIIRIRFPDKKIIQGYFHPRHKMSDIYSWLDSECISDEFKSLLHVSAERSNNNSTAHNSFNNNLLINKNRQQNGQSNYCFELYQSPPYRALLSRDETDLVTLRLAPAAVINFKWNYDLPTTSFTMNIDYLSENLSSKSAGKYEHSSTKSMSNTTNPVAIPMGVSLVQPSSQTETINSTVKSNNLTSISSSSDTATADSKVNSKDTWKPKWFKT